MQTHCFLNLWILLVFVSYFAQDLHYVSYKVFLIKGTGCILLRSNQKKGKAEISHNLGPAIQWSPAVSPEYCEVPGQYPNSFQFTIPDLGGVGLALR